eukprot:gene2079-2707_t
MNYQQPSQLQAVVLDWAGTVVDFGSFAPTQIFVEAFAEFGVAVSLQEARGPMGMGKWDHIRTLCNEPQIAARYHAVFGRLPTDDDVTALYERFMPLQIEKIALHVADALGQLGPQLWVQCMFGIPLDLARRFGADEVFEFLGEVCIADSVVIHPDNPQPLTQQAIATEVVQRRHQQALDQVAMGAEQEQGSGWSGFGLGFLA